jgi:predicted GTPase
MKVVIVLVGRPDEGKSRLFNRLVVATFEKDVNFATEAANMLFFVVDARVECRPMDHEIAVNKIDSKQEINRVSRALCS